MGQQTDKGLETPCPIAATGFDRAAREDEREPGTTLEQARGMSLSPAGEGFWVTVAENTGDGIEGHQ
ncbi:hypothetical protein PV726_32825 [Streptomyces europaeiscabiei]|uniref:hypothetical protein n=1 Tax=Streptomyces europaeiscabiei TaxID=146819 RepID=UPI0029B953FB|nr:hypothetical protein [Streptomyces europaeiscabiei]MDX3695041.1 hypothetical protein [Streptomyces europaeiscabiei]